MVEVWSLALGYAELDTLLAGCHMAGVNHCHQVFCGMRQAANPEMRERSLKQLLTRQRKGSQCLVATAQDMLSPSEEVGGAKKGRWRRVVIGWTGWSPGG